MDITQITQPKAKQKRAGSKAQASALENEMKGFLLARSRTTAYRAATYRPTLDKFKSTSFSGYVRAVLMGVPLENVEAEDPYYPGDSDSDDGSIHSVDTSTTGSSKPVCEKVRSGDNEQKALTTIITTINNTADEVKEEIEEVKEEIKEEPPKMMVTRRMATRAQNDASSSSKQPSEKENIYQKQYSTPSPPLKRIRNVKKERGPPLKPDTLKLSDGFAKITPPIGWWDKAGIGKDTTARGAPWQKGTPLGDMQIPGPIKQCAAGIGGIYDFTMMELPTITVADFRDRADKYRKKQMNLEVDDDDSDDHIDELARKFWKRLGPTMESSQYGADMEGSLFDGAEACGWNVDQLQSCLGLLEADYKNADEVSEKFKLPGVTSAYLYFGMWASVFSAHTEDMNLLSINYLHAGAPKYWYAIAEEDADRFESLMKSMFSHQANDCNEFLRHKRSLISPQLLTKAGISYTTQVQRAGDIMITFPGSYHFGFNTGFNCAESTNFAVPEWVPFGNEANICMCHPHSVRIDMRRFKTLLDHYEDDIFNLEGPKPTYTEWVKNHIKKKKKRTVKEEEPIDATQKGGRPKAFRVEVMKLSSRRNTKGGGKVKTASKSLAASKKKTKRNKEMRDIESESYHSAAPMKSSQMKPQTNVICLLDTDNDVQCYFAGVIVDIVEEHAKIHFAGSTRSEDVWLTIDSGKLFLDGGVAEGVQ